MREKVGGSEVREVVCDSFRGQSVICEGSEGCGIRGGKVEAKE